MCCRGGATALGMFTHLVKSDAVWFFRRKYSLWEIGFVLWGEGWSSVSDTLFSFSSSIYLYSCYMGIGGKDCETPDKAEENYLRLKVISAPHFNGRPLRNNLIYMMYFRRVSHHGNNKEQNRPNTVVPSMKIPAFHSWFNLPTLQTLYIVNWFFLTFLHVISMWW